MDNPVDGWLEDAYDSLYFEPEYDDYFDEDEYREDEYDEYDEIVRVY